MPAVRRASAPLKARPPGVRAVGGGRETVRAALTSPMSGHAARRAPAHGRLRGAVERGRGGANARRRLPRSAGAESANRSAQSAALPEIHAAGRWRSWARPPISRRRRPAPASPASIPPMPARRPNPKQERSGNPRARRPMQAPHRPMRMRRPPTRPRPIRGDRAWRSHAARRLALPDSAARHRRLCAGAGSAAGRIGPIRKLPPKAQGAQPSPRILTRRSACAPAPSICFRRSN